MKLLTLKRALVGGLMATLVTAGAAYAELSMSADACIGACTIFCNQASTPEAAGACFGACFKNCG